MTKNSLNHLAAFLNKFSSELKTPIADYGGTDNIGNQVVRTMLKAGGITDYHMLDYDNGIDLLKPIKGKKFGTGICMDLLEHTNNPFIVVENIKKSLKSGALLFVTVPWIWEIHHVPRDLWRFTSEGVYELFKDMEVITIYQVRDPADDEDLPRERIVGIFRKK